MAKFSCGSNACAANLAETSTLSLLALHSAWPMSYLRGCLTGR